MIDNNKSTVEQEGIKLTLPVLKIDGTQSGETIDLDPRLFGIPRNDHVLYLAVKAEMTNNRQGTRATKNRALVNGGSKKPFRQKGRGTARAGTSRSPLWRGGGTMFGPQPIDFEMKIPKKVRKLARRVALSVKALSGSIILLEDFDLEQPRTKKIAEILKNLKTEGNSSLIMVNGYKPVIVKSCQNIPRLEIRDAVGASTTDILRARNVIICRSAVESLGGLLN